MQIGGAEVLTVWWRKNVGKSFNAPVPRVSFHLPWNFNDQIVLQRLPQPKPQRLNHRTAMWSPICQTRIVSPKDTPLKLTARPWENGGFETILSFLGNPIFG